MGLSATPAVAAVRNFAEDGSVNTVPRSSVKAGMSREKRRTFKNKREKQMRNLRKIRLGRGERYSNEIETE